MATISAQGLTSGNPKEVLETIGALLTFMERLSGKPESSSSSTTFRSHVNMSNDLSPAP